MFKQALRLRAPHSLSRTSGVPNNPTEATSSQQYNKIQHRQCSNSTRVKLKWDLLSAVCVERHPIIAKPMEEIEARYHEYLQKVQLEKSLMSDFEMRAKREKAELQKKEVDINVMGQKTTKDFEDETLHELQSFKFAPVVTESDRTNDTTSLDRKLEKSLILLTKQRVGNTEVWIPPQGHRNDGETMRQAAERVLQNVCGAEMTVSFYGNAPIGFYKYRYPKAIREQGTYGAKIFYFLAKYVKGDISNDVKHQWLDHEELAKTVHPKMHKSISLFLLSP